MAEPLIGERRIASSHPLLMAGSLAAAVGCLSLPVWMGLEAWWGWLEGIEKAGFALYTIVMIGFSAVFFRIAIVVGLYASEEGLRVQRLLRSETIRWREIGKIVPNVSGRWLVLQRGQWGDLMLDGAKPEVTQRVFVPHQGIGISSTLSAKGLREFANLLLQHVPSEIWVSDPDARQWLTDQVESAGPFLSRLI